MAHVYILFLKDKSIKNGPRVIKILSGTHSHLDKLNQGEYSKYQIWSKIDLDHPWNHTHTYTQSSHKFLTMPPYFQLPKFVSPTKEMLYIFWPILKISICLHRLSFKYTTYHYWIKQFIYISVSDPDPDPSGSTAFGRIRIRIHLDFFPRIRIRIHLRKHWFGSG